jgi:predicted acyltransferase
VVFSEAWMKNASQRFYGMEHLLLMLLAIVLITIGSAKAKRASTDEKKFKTTYLFFTLGLVLILAGIPWPFREALGGGWF